jgi:signal peptide peptidase SppA
LDVNSPGGDVTKNFDLVDGMFATKRKPVMGIANEHAYSAAYSIISISDKIIVARTGGVGSIGVVTAHVDYSKMLEKAGMKVTFIKAGKHKTDGNPYEPLSAAVEARIQTRIDQIADIFYATVARNRGMDAKDVRATEASTYPASEAIKIGLADSIMSWDAAMSAFTASTKTERLFAMTTKTNESAEANEQSAQTKAAVDAAKVEGNKEGVTEGRKAERTRIKSILNSEQAKTRPVAAMATALNTDLSEVEATEFLAGLPEEPKLGASKNNSFEKAMATDNPNVGAAADDSGSDDKPDRVKDALAAHALVHGKRPTTK